MKSCKTMSELEKVFISSPVISDKDVIAEKNDMKLILK